MSPRLRRLAMFILGMGTIALTLGALMFQAAITTGADRDYTVAVSWHSALVSALSPISHFPFAPLGVVALVAAVTAFVTFGVRRVRAVPLLLVESGCVFILAGWAGSGLLLSEFTYNHFSLDGEVLGELWPTFESLAIWSMAVALLAFLRLFDQRHRLDHTITPNQAMQRTAR